MKPDQELREILNAVRSCLTAGRDWGLEPPSLSPAALAYLERTAVPSEPLSTLAQVRNLLGDCRRCKLWSGRTNLVFGEGAPSARLVFVGEAPGREEDIEGRPFTGETGKLLDRIVENGIGLKREDVYICNIVKCRPPDRKPEPDEIQACLPFLRKQLRIIKPQVICGLGQVAASSLIGRECKISRERGKWFSYMDVPFMPTLHPAYILRNPKDERRLKGLVWEDVKMIMAQMGLRSGG